MYHTCKDEVSFEDSYDLRAKTADQKPYDSIHICVRQHWQIGR